MDSPNTGCADPGKDKAAYINKMFASIASRYDFLNDVLSFSRHRAWRKYAVRLSCIQPGHKALDVCTGTGDFALEIFRIVGSTGLVVGSDFCAPMLRLGKQKSLKLTRGQVPMILADTLHLPFVADSFDLVTVGFGIRNVSDMGQAFREMARVTRTGGKMVCLEFTQPKHILWKTPVNFYQHYILPMIAACFSRPEAYRYLPDSIMQFNTREELKNIIRQAGWSDVNYHDLHFGSVCIHTGTMQ